MTDLSANETLESVALARRIRAHLEQLVVNGEPITYKALANAMGLTPPNTIHRVTQALECLMRDDAAHDRPFIAALVISRTRSGLPAPGFFELARQLGRFDGAPSGPDEAAYHASELAAVRGSRGTQEIREAAGAVC